jgi:large subunit ribosomal protein L24
VKLKVKKGSTVQVIAGSDKGKKGAVLEVNPTKMLVKVQGVRVQTHFDKKDGLKTQEGFLHYSNVKLVEAAAKKATSKKKTSSKTA